MLIGITGTLGAGKGTVVEYLKQKGFVHYSVRTFLWQEVDRRDLPRVRDNLSLVANDLRAQGGSEYIIKEIFKTAQTDSNNVIIESIHTMGEASFLRDNGAVILGVDADLKTRYERIQQRGSETDNVSFEKFKADNERDIASIDPSRNNIRAVIESDDYTITNDSTIEKLHVQVDEFLKQFST